MEDAASQRPLSVVLISFQSRKKYQGCLPVIEILATHSRSAYEKFVLLRDTNRLFSPLKISKILTLKIIEMISSRSFHKYFYAVSTNKSFRTAFARPCAPPLLQPRRRGCRERRENAREDIDNAEEGCISEIRGTDWP
eukprot:jgi/Bigna1/88366/estExt_fgenesh1_pg.C_310072